MVLTKVKNEIFSLANWDFEIFQDDEGNYSFHGATVCDYFEIKNPSVSIQRNVDEEWRFKSSVELGKGLDAWMIREPGIYQLAMLSKTPMAKKFQKWVYSDLLPKLRAEGGYIMPSATLEEALALVERHKNRLANLAKVHDEIQYKTGLYNHPRLALAAFTKACLHDFSESDKEEVKYLVNSHSSIGNYTWNVSVKTLCAALKEVAEIRIPEELLAYWLAEWGYTIKASGGKRLTGMYSVEMLLLTRECKLKMVAAWAYRNKLLKGK